MEQEEMEKVVEGLCNTTRDLLRHIMKKSGIRGDVEKLNSLVTFALNDNKMRSFFLGEFVPPTEENPNGEIRLHLDAIISYAEYLGTDYTSLVAKVFFCQIHHALTWESKKKFDFVRAEKFASKVCKKLAKQGIVPDLRPRMYIGETDHITFTARQKWIEKWTGAPFSKVMRELRGDDSDVTEGTSLPEGVCSGSQEDGNPESIECSEPVACGADTENG